MATWIFILIVGSSASVIEVNSQQECISLRATAQEVIDGNELLKEKAATGCFKNLGNRTQRS